MTAAREVLVVEDHAPTARLLTEAFTEVSSDTSCETVNTADDAIVVLRADDEQSFTPDVVILDLHLQRGNGFTVLEKMRDSSSIRPVPTVIFSEHDHPDAVARCYRLGAQTFVAKPVEWDGIITFVESIVDYWFGVAERPE